MFHKGGPRSVSGNAGSLLQQQLKALFDDFTADLTREVLSRQLQPAVVRAMLNCHLLVVVTRSSVIVAAEKTLGMGSTVTIDHSDKDFTPQQIIASARFEVGFDDPFVLSFPRSLLDKEYPDRQSQLHFIVQSLVTAEYQRVLRMTSLVQINPMWGPASFTVDQHLAFVLMPFDDDLTKIYESIIKPTVESADLGLVCKRADDYKTNRALMQDVWKGICEARLVIADLTRLNPNVMYELGIAHTVGKETILIYQKDASKEIKMPADFVHIKRIEYTNDAIGGRKLQVDLHATIVEVLTVRTLGPGVTVVDTNQPPEQSPG